MSAATSEGCFGSCPCCWLFSGDEVGDGDKFANNQKMFHTTMLNSGSVEPLACLGAFICPCCANMKLRKDVLGGDMNKYICCQGMFHGCCCLQPGQMGEKDCPGFCLCLEAWFCVGLAVSASRWYVMEQRGLHSDPCDRRIIRVNNCLQCLSCICSLLTICFDELGDAADCVRHVSKCFFLCTQACMCAQVHHELKVNPSGKWEESQPMTQVMT